MNTALLDLKQAKLPKSATIFSSSNENFPNFNTLSKTSNTFLSLLVRAHLQGGEY